MSDQSASPIDERPWWSPDPFVPLNATPEQAEFLHRWFGSRMPMMSVDDQGVSLSMDDTLRVREQSIYAAALITDCTPFPEDDAEKVVEIAKRFEKFIRSGQ